MARSKKNSETNSAIPLISDCGRYRTDHYCPDLAVIHGSFEFGAD